MGLYSNQHEVEALEGSSVPSQGLVQDVGGEQMRQSLVTQWMGLVALILVLKPLKDVTVGADCKVWRNICTFQEKPRLPNIRSVSGEDASTEPCQRLRIWSL